MRRLVAAALAALASAAFAAKPLPRPFWGDPALQATPPPRAGLDAAEFFTLFVGDGAPTGLTVCGWARYDCAEGVYPYPLALSAMFSASPARATAEGGAGLANLTSSNWWDGAEDLPLAADGTWAEACLPASYALPSAFAAADRWRHGCYAVNVSADAPITLTVGGFELQVPATNRLVRNVLAASASRFVSVAASVPSARVRLGVAENPLVQFVGAQLDSCDPLRGDAVFDGGLGGVVTNGWRFVAARARIDGGTGLAVRVCGWTRSRRLENEGAAAQALWRPAAAFPRGARVRVALSGMAGLGGAAVRGHAWRAYPAWLDDALLERMRDQDWAELVRRGLVRPGDEDAGADAAVTQGGGAE